MKNTIARGSEAELLFASECVKRDMVVSFPISHSSEYDLIIDTPLGLKKIQVKRAYKVNNHGYTQLCVETRRILVKHSGKKGSIVRSYSKNGYDFLAAYNVDTNDYWIIPRDITRKYKAQIYLGSKLDDYKNQWILLGVDISS